MIFIGDEILFTKTMDIKRVEDIVLIFGDFDSNIKRINVGFADHITQHSDTLTLVGDPEHVMKAERLINTLLIMISKGEQIGDQSLN